MAARIVRVWIELDEYDPDTDQWTDLPIDFGPSIEIVATDGSSAATAAARVAAIVFAEQLQGAALLLQAGDVDQDDAAPAERRIV